MQRLSPVEWGSLYMARRRENGRRRPAGLRPKESGTNLSGDKKSCSLNCKRKSETAHSNGGKLQSATCQDEPKKWGGIGKNGS